jgi:hypothetical protein
MNRCIVAALMATGILTVASNARAQEQAEKQVSGPEQMNSQRSTGKSYKKGTSKPAAKEKNPSTGQKRRHGNTANLTKNGDDVNGKRAEGSGAAKQPQQQK